MEKKILSLAILLTTAMTGAWAQGAADNQVKAAVDTVSKQVFIPGTDTVYVWNKNLTSGDAAELPAPMKIAFDITGIADGSFKGCNEIRYIDATEIQNYVPSSLDRAVQNTPFEGLPKQTLVYLSGSTVEGENYIWKTTEEGDYRCETYKIYDDVKGDQLGFNDSIAAAWDIMIPIGFNASTVTNTRRLNVIATDNSNGTYTNNKTQAYTACLPYDLPIPASFKAYILKYAKVDQVGFDEVTGTLKAFTPYLLVPSASGQPLSTTDAEIKQTYKLNLTNDDTEFINHGGTDDGFVKCANPSIISNGYSYIMEGTMMYSPDNYVFILQSNNKWKTNPTDPKDRGYKKACILAMRAYISMYAPGGDARETMARQLSSMFYDAEGNATVMEGLEIDTDSKAPVEIYDFLGNKITEPKAGTLYIVGGKKQVWK